MRSGYQAVSGLVFGLISILQLVRAIRQLPVQIGTVSVPVSVSWVAFVVAGTLCLWAFRSRGARRPDA